MHKVQNKCNFTAKPSPRFHCLRRHIAYRMVHYFHVAHWQQVYHDVLRFMWQTSWADCGCTVQRRSVWYHKVKWHLKHVTKYRRKQTHKRTTMY